jgi:hypothetical protein
VGKDESATPDAMAALLFRNFRRSSSTSDGLDTGFFGIAFSGLSDKVRTSAFRLIQETVLSKDITASLDLAFLQFNKLSYQRAIITKKKEVLQIPNLNFRD